MAAGGGWAGQDLGDSWPSGRSSSFDLAASPSLKSKFKSAPKIWVSFDSMTKFGYIMNYKSALCIQTSAKGLKES